MTPLDIVTGLTGTNEVAAKQPHHIKVTGYPYLFPLQSHNLRACRINAAVRQAGCPHPVHSEKDKWRNRCQRASSHSSRLALWPSWRPVPKTNPSKSSLWLTQSRSQQSQPTLANTSKATRLTHVKTCGQAKRPVGTPTNHQTHWMQAVPHPQQKGALA